MRKLGALFFSSLLATSLFGDVLRERQIAKLTKHRLESIAVDGTVLDKIFSQINYGSVWLDGNVDSIANYRITKDAILDDWIIAIATEDKERGGFSETIVFDRESNQFLSLSLDAIAALLIPTGNSGYVLTFIKSEGEAGKMEPRSWFAWYKNWKDNGGLSSTKAKIGDDTKDDASDDDGQEPDFEIVASLVQPQAYKLP